MVKYALKISATVENISEITTSGPDFEWRLKLQCRDCNEIDPSWHSIFETDEVESKHGPGVFNFQMKCKLCSNVSTIDVVKGSIKPLKVNDNDIIDKQVVAAFDCRGVEPIAFQPQGKWIAKCSETNTVFDDVEFTPDEDIWIGYDEKGNVPVSIDKFQGCFERL
ncbi:hypothetical protein O3M35_000372 [Rhynocoris fuscipes]|uniref:Uncharacterized protein n=1 Tax=Rhynocoris fuscipes TaxID=488301 RepID=A0AAW1DN95_9HEMI